MNITNRVVLLSGPEGDHSREQEMRFRLIYDGPLQSTQRDPENGQRDPLALHKHKIRQCFHGQLKRLWETDKFLSTCKKFPSDFGVKRPVHDDAARWGGDASEMTPLRDIVANLYDRNGYRFVPLVREDWDLLCNLDILFLRRDIPGGVINAGDIDNRIKTLIDALRMPKDASELAGNETPGPDEDPFYCLMEEDKLVTSLAVESDALLDPNEIEEVDNRRVRLVITVTLKPYYATNFNLQFA